MPGIYLRIPDSWDRIKTNCAAGKGKSAAKASAGKTPRVHLKEMEDTKENMREKTKGILCITTAAFCFALMSLFVRLAGDVPSIQKSFFRNLVALAVVGVPMILHQERVEIGKGDLKFLVLRAVFGTIGIFGNFYAIDHLVLSDANMLNKLAPFFVVIFSALFLRERANLVQIASVIVAFVGALFIIKPTGNMEGSGALAGFLGGAGAGAAYTMVRLLGKRGVKGKTVIVFFSAFSCLAAVPFMIGSFQPMELWQVLMLFAAGGAAAGGQIFVTKAYYYAPAKEISVYDYSQIVFAALMGFVVLGQRPDLYSVLGYLIIGGTAVFVYFYNKSEA